MSNKGAVRPEGRRQIRQLTVYQVCQHLARCSRCTTSRWLYIMSSADDHVLPVPCTRYGTAVPPRGPCVSHSLTADGKSVGRGQVSNKLTSAKACGNGRGAWHHSISNLVEDPQLHGDPAEIADDHVCDMQRHKSSWGAHALVSIQHVRNPKLSHPTACYCHHCSARTTAACRRNALLQAQPAAQSRSVPRLSGCCFGFAVARPVPPAGDTPGAHPVAPTPTRARHFEGAWRYLRAQRSCGLSA